MKLAAIDIGSNAARLLIMQVVENQHHEPSFNKLNLIRIPLRLGFDVFNKGEISETRKVHIMETMKAYKFLLEVYEVDHLKACATASLRNASNGKEILKEIVRETGIPLKIISGQEEAGFIFQNHIAEKLNNSGTYLYIDVGGGSTELCIYHKNKLKAKESFNIGTISLLEGLIKAKHWEPMKEFLKRTSRNYVKIMAIGSGGNINKIFTLSGKKDGKPIYLAELGEYFDDLSSLTIDERINTYRLSPDRADVIVPALQIYINVMRWAQIEKIFVPKIGLADGLIHALYEEVQQKRTTASKRGKIQRP